MGAQLWVRNCGCATVGARLWVRDCGSATVGARLWVRDCGCATVGARLWVRDCGCATVGVQLWVSNCGCATVGAQLWVCNWASVFLHKCMVFHLSLIHGHCGRSHQPRLDGDFRPCPQPSSHADQMPWGSQLQAGIAGAIPSRPEVRWGLIPRPLTTLTGLAVGLTGAKVQEGWTSTDSQSPPWLLLTRCITCISTVKLP